MLAYIAESLTLGGLNELVSRGDVACNAHTEVPLCFNIAHGRDCELEFYTTTISTVVLPCLEV